MKTLTQEREDALLAMWKLEDEGVFWADKRMKRAIKRVADVERLMRHRRAVACGNHWGSVGEEE